LVSAGVKEIYYIDDYKNNPIVEEINKDLKIILQKI
jgi:deoxycytidylate deaminase